MQNHSNFDQNLRTLYFEGRERAYNNPNIWNVQHAYLFQYIKVQLIRQSPNRDIHRERLSQLKTLYYNGQFRNLYDSLGLDLFYGYETGHKKFKSKDMIILVLYFYTPSPY